MTIESRVETLSPSDCKKILEANNHNRPLRGFVVARYAGQMRNGEWKTNGEPIIIANDGSVLDGQHRLHACIESGIPITTLVVRGVEKSVFSTLDTGSSRNGSDVLSIHGLTPEIARSTSSAAGFSIVFQHYGTGSISKGQQVSHLITPKKCSEWVLSNPRVIEIAERVASKGRYGRILAAGQIVFLWFHAERKNYDDTQEFFEGLLSGANLSEKDPRLVLRSRIEAMKSAKVSWGTQSRMGAVVRAWKWYCEGRDVDYPSNLYRKDVIVDALKMLLPEPSE